MSNNNRRTFHRNLFTCFVPVRCGLRTFILLIATFGLACSLVGLELRRAAKQNGIIAEIAPVTIHVQHDLTFRRLANQGEEYAPRRWLRDRFGDRYFGRVKDISFGGGVSDNDVRMASRISTLRNLTFMTARITPEIVQAIGECGQIRGLQFFKCSYDCNVFDQAGTWSQIESFEIGTAVRGNFAHFSFLESLHSLTDLAISFATLNFGDVTRYVHKSELTHLTLMGVTLTSGLDGLEELPNLVYLDVSESSVADSDIPKILRISGLRSLHLTGTEITDTGFQHIIDVPISSLRVIYVDGTHISRQMVQRIRTAYPKCRIAGSSAEFKGDANQFRERPSAE